MQRAHDTIASSPLNTETVRSAEVDGLAALALRKAGGLLKQHFNPRLDALRIYRTSVLRPDDRETGPLHSVNRLAVGTSVTDLGRRGVSYGLEPFHELRFWCCGCGGGDVVGYFDGCVDAKGATEGVPCSDFRDGGLGDVFVIEECGEDAWEEGIIAVVRD